jgi:hypothetical protein
MPLSLGGISKPRVRNRLGISEPAGPMKKGLGKRERERDRKQGQGQTQVWQRKSEEDR